MFFLFAPGELSAENFQATKTHVERRDALARTLSAALYLGFSSREQLLRLRLALLSWMLLAGDHSLHELMLASTPGLVGELDAMLADIADAVSLRHQGGL